MAQYKNNVNTPLIKLNKVTDDIPALVLAKVETYNPGHSIKDRMALKMVEDAEKDTESCRCRSNSLSYQRYS